MEYNLKVSSSPHILSKNRTSRIMQDVVIALLPATGMAIYYFRSSALFLILTSVLSCLLAEYLWIRVLKKRNTLSDFSAVVTGLLLALNLPPQLPLWLAAIGGFFAIIIVKQFFGGIGSNFINPVLGARAFLVASWPAPMTTWISPITDAVSSATPLALLKEGGVGLRNLPPLWDMFAGNIGGSLGETSALALLIGGGYLLFRKVISPAIPFSYLGTMAIFAWIFGGEILFSGEYIYHLLAGGLMIGAFFMATDYTTSPTTFKGRIIFGVGCGLLTGIIRIYGGYPGGVSFAILLMNLTVPLIERGTIPKSFGGAKKHA